MSEYPLDPFTEFATRQNDPAEFEIVPGPVGWGLMKPERRAEPAPMHGQYTGVGVENPFGDQTPAPAVARAMQQERAATAEPSQALWLPDQPDPA